jgi:hypothetical protein
LWRVFLFLEGNAVESNDREGHGSIFRFDEHVGRLATLEMDVIDSAYVIIVDYRTRLVQVDMVVLRMEAYATKQEGQ